MSARSSALACRPSVTSRGVVGPAHTRSRRDDRVSNRSRRSVGRRARSRRQWSPSWPRRARRHAAAVRCAVVDAAGGRCSLASTTVFVTGSLMFAASFAALPAVDDVLGHGRQASRLGRRCRRRAARRGLGAVRLVGARAWRCGWHCFIAGFDDPVRSRAVAGAVVVTVVVLLVWGFAEAMRVPPVGNCRCRNRKAGQRFRSTAPSH